MLQFVFLFINEGEKDVFYDLVWPFIKSAWLLTDLHTQLMLVLTDTKVKCDAPRPEEITVPSRSWWALLRRNAPSDSGLTSCPATHSNTALSLDEVKNEGPFFYLSCQPVNMTEDNDAVENEVYNYEH